MSASTSELAPVGRSIVRVRGGVQGVGFRPFVYGLAVQLGLAGLVGNDSDGVFIEIEGPVSVIEQFLLRLTADAPPLARIHSVDIQAAAVSGALGFAIVSSRRDSERVTPVAPDVATCAECLREMSSPSDRRHRYPFINFTNCGPRYTIVTALPYDRAQTTMATFTMCVDCECEYADPSDRRYHAQPNACTICGPQLAWRENTSREVSARGEAALGSALTALRAGQIIAVQGVGGFHIACRADDERAVLLLRTRKYRPEKPLAVMVRDLHEAPRPRNCHRRGSGAAAVARASDRAADATT